MDEVELQRRLTRLAERTAPPPREALAAVVVARHRSRRRQAIAAAALAAAVAALVVAPRTTFGDTPSAEPATATARSARIDVLAGPPRGSLAGDATFVAAVRQLPWTSPDSSVGVPGAAADTRRVAFVGDVAGARWALVVGRHTFPADPGDVAIAWFSGPPGATPAQLELDSGPYDVDPTLPLARLATGTGALVVIAAPGDEIEVSARPDVAADGTATRVWQAVDAADGVAVTTLPAGGAGYSTAARYRVERDGAEVTTSTPDGVPDATARTATVPVTWLRRQPTAGDDAMAGSAVDDVLAQTGLSPADVTATALWVGEVPGPRDRRARVVLLAVTLPSGAVYLTAPFDWTGADGGGVDGTCGSTLQPAGVPLEQRALAARCDVFDGEQLASGSSSLVVLAPGSTTTRVVDMTGVRLADVPLVDGSTVLPAPQRLGAVGVSGPDPSTTGRLRLLSSADLGD